MDQGRQSSFRKWNVVHLKEIRVIGVDVKVFGECEFFNVATSHVLIQHSEGVSRSEEVGGGSVLLAHGYHRLNSVLSELNLFEADRNPTTWDYEVSVLDVRSGSFELNNVVHLTVVVLNVHKPEKVAERIASI